MNALEVPAKKSLWRRIGEFLASLDEAVHTNEVDLVIARVQRLERELEALKEKQP